MQITKWEGRSKSWGMCIDDHLQTWSHVVMNWFNNMKICIPTTLFWLGLESASQPWSSQPCSSLVNLDHLNLPHLTWNFLVTTNSWREDGGQITSLIFFAFEDGHTVCQRQHRPLLVPNATPPLCVCHPDWRFPFVDACPAVAAANHWRHSMIVEKPQRLCASFKGIFNHLVHSLGRWFFKFLWAPFFGIWIAEFSGHWWAPPAMPCPLFACCAFVVCFAAPTAVVRILVIVTNYIRAVGMAALPATPHLRNSHSHYNDRRLHIRVWPALALSVMLSKMVVALVDALFSVLDVIAPERAIEHVVVLACVWIFANQVADFSCIPLIPLHLPWMHCHALKHWHWRASVWSLKRYKHELMTNIN